MLTWKARVYGRSGSSFPASVAATELNTAVDKPRATALPSRNRVLKIPPARACWCDGRDCITYIFRATGQFSEKRA